MLEKIFNKDQVFVAIDSETCNLNLLSLENKPWAWGMVVFRGNDILEEHDIYVKWPNLKVSPDAARITGFNQHTIDKQGIDPEIAWNKLKSQLYDSTKIILVHNLCNFDLYTANIHCKSIGQKIDYSFITRSLDTNALMRGIKSSNLPKKGEDFIAYQFRMANTRVKGVKTSMESLCKEYDIEYDFSKAHSALYDCKLLFQLWKKIKKYFNYNLI